MPTEKSSRLRNLKEKLQVGVEKHKLIRRLLLLWSVVLTTVILLRLTEPSTISVISDAAALVLVPIVGLLQVIVIQYQYQRGKDNAGQ